MGFLIAGYGAAWRCSTCPGGGITSPQRRGDKAVAEVSPQYVTRWGHTSLWLPASNLSRKPNTN
jgi:hypothetical protein